MEEVKNLSGLECYLNKPIKRLRYITLWHLGPSLNLQGGKIMLRTKSPRKAIILGQNREDYKTYCPCCPC